MEVFLAIPIFLGSWLSWKVGYHINDWVVKIFSYRVRATDNHLLVAKISEMEKTREDTHYDGMSLPCRECGDTYIGGDHSHAREYTAEEIDALEAEVEALAKARRDAEALEYMEDNWDIKLLDDVKTLNELGGMKEAVESMNTEQRDALYFLIQAAMERVEEEEYTEIVTYGGNVRYVTHNSPKVPPYDHLDL